MNNYFKTFQNIAHIDTMTVDENSTEIKQSAIKLKESVQPCFDELRQSASKLKELLKVSFAELEHAEDVWNSKPRIAQASTLEILEQIGELTGYDVKISQLGNKYKFEAIEKANKSWNNRIERLKEKWFVNPKNKQLKEGVGWNEKEGFVKELDPEVTEQMVYVIVINKKVLSHLYQEFVTIDLKLIQNCVALLDWHSQTGLNNRIELIVKQIENKFNNPKDYINQDFNGFNNTVARSLYFLVNPGWGVDITRKDVDKFKEEVTARIEKEINSVFHQRIELVTKAIAEAIAFYNDFLEKQARYQQETPEQREAEKAWIEQQRQELEQIQQGIEEILN